MLSLSPSIRIFVPHLEGHFLTGTRDPLICLIDMEGVHMLKWKPVHLLPGFLPWLRRVPSCLLSIGHAIHMSPTCGVCSMSTLTLSSRFTTSGFKVRVRPQINYRSISLTLV